MYESEISYCYFFENLSKCLAVFCRSLQRQYPADCRQTNFGCLGLLPCFASQAPFRQTMRPCVNSHYYHIEARITSTATTVTCRMRPFCSCSPTCSPQLGPAGCKLCNMLQHGLSHTTLPCSLPQHVNCKLREHQISISRIFSDLRC